MTKDDIIRMAREAGLELTMWQLSFGYETCVTHEELERFANLVAAAEREACAKVFDEMADEAESEREPSSVVNYYRAKATAIRARGQHD